MCHTDYSKAWESDEPLNSGSLLLSSQISVQFLMSLQSSKNKYNCHHFAGLMWGFLENLLVKCFPAYHLVRVWVIPSQTWDSFRCYNYFSLYLNGYLIKPVSPTRAASALRDRTPLFVSHHCAPDFSTVTGLYSAQ